MKAPDFDYLRPASLDEAVAALAAGGGDAALLAGGQSLMPMMNFRIANPTQLIDLGAIAALRGITRAKGVVRIGAMTRYRDLEGDAALLSDLPLLAKALPLIAHEAIRTRGTLGGSLALADPAAEMPAVMMALGATIDLVGPKGLRRIAADAFFLGLYDTARAADEVITAIEIPLGGGIGTVYELAPRHGDYALAGVAVQATSSAPWSGLRAAFFGITDRPIMLDAISAAFEGQRGVPEAAMQAAQAALADLDYLNDARTDGATRRHYAGVVLQRALKELLG